jgi:hypothetical protein
MDRQVKIRNMVNAQVGVNDSSLGVKKSMGQERTVACSTL